MTTFEKHIRSIDKSRIQETLLYLVMWLLIILFPILNEAIEYSRGHNFEWEHIIHWWLGTIPYLVVFFIHDIAIVHVFLLKGRLKLYFFFTLCLLSAFYFSKRLMMDKDMFNAADQKEYIHKLPPDHSIHNPDAYGFPPPKHIPGSRPPRPHMPFPHLVNLFIAFLMFGLNVAVSLLFKYYREMDTLEATENMRIRNELKYLKTQISPHFFMNMLNNIHAMIEKDPVKAQDLIIELSKIMRYVLYEGNHNTTTFADEVKFISSYIQLMRQRYSAEKVSIELSLPEKPSSAIKLPPLLFITFVENAFKHGISYCNNSVIKVSLEENNGKIHFKCFNSKPKTQSASILKGGVGLENVHRRLDLIYGNSYILELIENEDNYTVILTIPCL